MDLSAKYNNDKKKNGFTELPDFGVTIKYKSHGELFNTRNFNCGFTISKPKTPPEL